MLSWRNFLWWYHAELEWQIGTAFVDDFLIIKKSSKCKSYHQTFGKFTDKVI